MCTCVCVCVYMCVYVCVCVCVCVYAFLNVRGEAAPIFGKNLDEGGHPDLVQVDRSTVSQSMRIDLAKFEKHSIFCNG